MSGAIKPYILKIFVTFFTVPSSELSLEVLALDLVD